MRDLTKSDKPPCFLAKLYKADDEKHSVVVKFVYNYIGTYGTVVHQYLHKCGLAPFLYSVENLHPGLVMAVMEYLLPFKKGIGGWVELDEFEGKLGPMADVVRKRLDEIVKLLQDEAMVHADFRPWNVMAKVDGNGDMMVNENGPIFSVIDFDWAGKVGEVCYPPFLNPRIPWPPGAKALRRLERTTMPLSSTVGGTRW
jgi:hypothetical protein